MARKFAAIGVVDQATRIALQSMQDRIVDLEALVRVPNRNLLDNGAMNVCQRATSIAGVATDSGQRVVDRYVPRNNALGTYTYSQTADAPASTEFSKCLKMLCTAADAAPAAGDFLLISQNVEGGFAQHLLWGTTKAKPVTLSFWAKGTAGTYVAEVLSNNAAVRTISSYFTINAANVWEYKTLTFPGDTGQPIINDTAARLQVNLWLAGGTNYTGAAALARTWGVTANNARAVGVGNLSATINNFVEVTGVQLEAGSAATPFETRRYDAELSACRRQLYVISLAGVAFAWGQCWTTTTGQAHFPLDVPFRAAPTLTCGGVGADYQVWNAAAGGVALASVPTLGGLIVGGPSVEVRFTTATASLAAGSATSLFLTFSGGGVITLSAEI